jgi:hypothetical protein
MNQSVSKVGTVQAIEKDEKLRKMPDFLSIGDML